MKTTTAKASGRPKVESPAEARGIRYTGDQAIALKLFTVLFRASTAVRRRSESNIAGHGVSPAEFAILEALFHKGPLLLGEVQRKVLVSSGGITYLVDRLEAQGLVERRACQTDRRARYAALTAKGERWMERVFPDHARALEEIMAGLSAQEQQAALELLKKLGHHAAAAEE
ncbi:MAG: MarR family transcriptional regulator [Gemmatimonadetes bacterium]|nr:MarR family transcriptional regulator [Gemmatimonadota bacterium]